MATRLRADDVWGVVSRKDLLELRLLLYEREAALISEPQRLEKTKNAWQLVHLRALSVTNHSSFCRGRLQRGVDIIPDKIVEKSASALTGKKFRKGPYLGIGP